MKKMKQLLKQLVLIRTLVWKLRAIKKPKWRWAGVPPGREIYKMVEKKEWPRLESLIIEHAVNSTQTSTQENRSVLVVGYRQTGKSAVSDLLGKNGGFYVIPLDRLRLAWDYIEEPETQRQVKVRVCTEVLNRSKGNVVLEGDSLLYSYWRPGSLFPSVSLDLISSIKRITECEIYFVGNSETSIEEKLDAIEKHRDENASCWTNSLDDEERSRIAEESLAISKILRDNASKYSALYYEVNPQKFEESLNSVATDIMNRKRFG